MMLKSLIFSHLLVPALAASCQDYQLTVPAQTKNNIVFSPDTDLTTEQGVTAFLGTLAGGLGQGIQLAHAGGTYKIGARYCKPAGNAPANRAKTVQLLFHGVPYTKEYWAGDGVPGAHEYSWIDYATSQGYHVLAIDNLGSGNSTKANPITEVQQPLETEIVNNIIKMLRTGKASPAPQMDRVIFVGHSLGSVLGNGIAAKYPKSLDALILTGYSSSVAQAALAALAFGLTPASSHDKKRFGNLPPGYLTFGSLEGKRQTYYGAQSAFSMSTLEYDFNHEGTTTVGELATLFSGLQVAQQFTGPVLVVTGQQDALFCEMTTGTRIPFPPSCSVRGFSTPARSFSYFPKSPYFDWHLAPLTGHATTLHHTAQDSMTYAHGYLDRRGF